MLANDRKRLLNLFRIDGKQKRLANNTRVHIVDEIQEMQTVTTLYHFYF